MIPKTLHPHPVDNNRKRRAFAGGKSDTARPGPIDALAARAGRAGP